MKQLIFQSLFLEIVALLTLAAAVGFVGNLLRQPLIVSFIAAGIIAGPSVLHIARSSFDAVVIGPGRYEAVTSIRPWSAPGERERLGHVWDGMDPEFVAGLPLGDVQWVISAIPDHDTGVTHTDPSLTVTGAVRSAGFKGRVAMTNRTGHDMEGLVPAGANLALDPIQDAADEAVELISSPTHPEREVGGAMDEQKDLR